MALPAERPAGFSNLQKRILSAAVLLPVAVAAIMFGHPYFSVLVAVFAGLMAWEWTRVAAHVRTPAQTSPIPIPTAPGWPILMAASVATAIGAVGLTAIEGLSSHVWIVLLVGVVATIAIGLAASRQRAIWFVTGVVYVTVPAVALVAVRADPIAGRDAVVWIIALVVAADTGGYLVGRSIGGPKLVPRISPNKTWAGLGGAVAGAALVGFLTAFVLNHTDVWMLTVISAGLGLVEQAGDLVESAFKRHFGVKDTSQIIPGHGGVLDRVDGLLAVAVAVLALSLWAGGSVLAW